MTTDPMAGLARKWCRKLWGSDHRDDIVVVPNGCATCDVIAAAIREVLEEAKKAICFLCAQGFPLDGANHIPTQRLGMIPVTLCLAAPLAALRGGTDA